MTARARPQSPEQSGRANPGAPRSLRRGDKRHDVFLLYSSGLYRTHTKMAKDAQGPVSPSTVPLASHAPVSVTVVLPVLTL